VGEQWVLEACLSVDLPAVNVKRAEEGTLIARDENWEEIQAHVFGFDCAVFQHEIDHLDGLLYTDRIPRLELDLLKRKVAKAKRHLRKYGTANPLL
jgi:peptide deformylase